MPVQVRVGRERLLAHVAGPQVGAEELLAAFLAVVGVAEKVQWARQGHGHAVGEEQGAPQLGRERDYLSIPLLSL